jgi:hypothetical protein
LGGGLVKIFAAIGIVGLFALSRAVLLATSYDSVSNWEEPAFLFSATELLSTGPGHLFDHQDDLNHGGSIALLVFAVPWVATFGTSLVTLKGLAVVWSTLALGAMMAVTWRYFSPGSALLVGLFYTTLSPTLAKLDVTLVGSHPEALLPCALAAGAYLECIRRARSGMPSTAANAAFGITCGIAMWFSYSSATFVMPLLAFRLVFSRQLRGLAPLAFGAALGSAPWLWQNLWLRPHGAFEWADHLSTTAPLATASLWTDWIGSFGHADWLAGALIAGEAIGLAALVAIVWRPGRRPRAADPFLAGPFALAPIIGLILLALAARPLYPDAGYYHYRYFALLHAAFLWAGALAAQLAGRRTALAAALASVAIGVAQAPIYGTGNEYVADFEADRARGCFVFGVAEWKRSGDPPAGLKRLATLSDDRCRRNAIGGFGWQLARSSLQDRDPEVLARVTEAARSAGVSRPLCPAALKKLRAASVLWSQAEREAAAQRVKIACDREAF